MMQVSHLISAIDTHTAGEPTRVITGGLPRIPGETVTEKRHYFRTHLAHLRGALMNEPRGHRNMFGAVLSPSREPEVEWDLFFIDGSGSDVTMCGHATIGTGVMLVQLGMVEAQEPETVIRFATPAGRVDAHVMVEKGRAEYAWFENVPAFLCAGDIRLEVAGLGRLNVDIAYGGNYFCIVPEERLGIVIDLRNSEQLLSVGACVSQAINAQFSLPPGLPDGSQAITLVQIVGRAQDPGAHSRNVVVGPRTIDRSPCGTGTCARMAALYAQGQLQLDETFVHESIIGSLFYGRLLRTTTVGEVPAVIPTVGGKAFITGIQQFVIDPDDPMKYGFQT